MCNSENDFTVFEKRKIEARKLQVDYLKHLTTLDTASLIIMATFLSNFFSNPKFTWLLFISFFCFMLSIVGCLIMQGHCVIEIENGKYNKYSPILAIAFISAFLGFGVGLLFLVIFSLLNF